MSRFIRICIFFQHFFGESSKVLRLKDEKKWQNGALNTYERLCNDSMRYMEERGLQNEAHFKVLYANCRGANVNYNERKGFIS